VSAGLFAAEIVRCFIAWWWLAAVVGKLRTWPHFRDALGSSFGLAPAAAAAVAPAVVLVETLAAVMVSGTARPAGMLASLVLMAGFTSALGYQFYTRAIVRCSCFGESVRPLSGYDVTRNLLVVLTIAAWLVLAPPGALPAGEMLVAAGLGAWLCVAALNFHDVVALSRTN
jgi:hypothetical protein